MINFKDIAAKNLAQADIDIAVAAGYVTLRFTDDVYTITTNTTIPSTCRIQATLGTIISVDSGVTLTVNCAVEAPASQVVFDGAGTIAGTFGSAAISPTWFGATGGVAPYGQAVADVSRTGYPVIDTIDGAITADGGDVVITGRNLIGEMEFDAATVTLGDDAGVLTITAVKPGVSGLAVDVLASDTGTSLGVDFLGSAITIQLSEAGDSAAEIVSAFNADASVDGVARCTATGSGDTTSAVAAVSMSGGSGDYDGTQVVVAGTAAPAANHVDGSATWSDTEITATASGTPLTATEVATMAIQVDGVWSNTLSFVVAAGE